MSIRVLMALVGAAASGAMAQVLVVCPNSRASVEGNDGNSYPFAAPGLNRYQQAYGAGSLASIVGQQITRVAFRLDSSHTSAYAGGFMYPAIVMRMSISPRTPDTLLAVMDSNVGPSPVTVHSGPYTLPTLNAGPTPRPFDMVITLEHPFVYTGGTLLLDVEGGLGPPLASGQTFFLDGENTAGDAIGRAYDVSFDTVFTDTRGLVTRFTAEPVVCYPNCDHSTAAPVLNVNDFSCFLNAFAAGQTYANCDGSTVTPVLNVNDFACFLNRFAAGC